MLKFLLQLLLLSAAAGLLVYSCWGEIEYHDIWDETTKTKMGWTKPSIKKATLVLIPLALYIGTMCVVSIPANNVGIKYSAISGTSEDTLKEGLQLKSPLDRIYTISTTVQERTIENVSVQTKDAQWVSMDINVKYSVNASNAFKVFQSYKTLENLQENLISNATQRSIEEITTKYNVMEVLGESRNTIYSEIEVNLKSRLASEGVDLKFITIKDTDAGEEIEKAIAAEAVAKKSVETAQQKQEQAKIEAETKLIKAKGEAEANAVKTNALTDQVLMEMWIEKWNGVLPTVSGSEGTMIDISSLMGGK